MKNFFVHLVAIITLVATTKINGQDLNPEPTSSSIQSYIKYKASPALGVPSVDIPLYTLESDDKKATVALSLSYHLYNSRSVMAPTEVGMGWTMFKGAIISKESGAKNNEFTEINDLTQQNSDRFYYSIPGFNGMFQIYKDTTTGELKLYDLNASKLKIEFVRDQASTKLIINSFKITDDKGLIYNFNAYNITAFQNHPLQPLKNQRTSYVPTTVTDINGRTLITYIYDLKTKTTLNPGGTTAIKYKINKLNTISTSEGKLKFTYDYNENADNGNQNKEYYTIKTVELLTTADRPISKYDLTIDVFNGLTVLKKMDSNSSQIESTTFGYGDGSDTQYGYIDDNGYSQFGIELCPRPVPFINPQKYVYRVLKEIYFPTRGRVEYAYEANEEYMDYSAMDFENANEYTDPFNQYYDITGNIPFDTNNTREYSFTVHGTPGVSYTVHVGRGLDEGIDYGVKQHGQPVAFNFSVLNASNTVMATDSSQNACTSTAEGKYYKLKPGTYKIKINFWGGTGNLVIVELKSLPKPYKNFHPVVYGARVKSITYYEEVDIVKQIKYEYNSFSNPNSSSGNLIDDPTYPYVIYKNVRETETAGNQTNGHTDYYYKIPYEYADPAVGNYIMPYFNLTSQGILTEKRIYNSQNQLLDTNEYIYTFADVPNAKPQINGYHQFTPAYISYMKERNISKLGNSDYITENESTFSPTNFQKTLSRLTTQDGNINETTIRYAQDVTDVRLIDANMVSVPLETIIKDNGTIVSTVKTIFGNTNHYYPTSIVTTDLAQIPETKINFDLYDEKGNVIQSTDKSGVSTVTIWGYHKTLPIVQIVGTTYSAISSLPVITTAITASDADADLPGKEGMLLSALENLRLDPVLKQYYVSVSTYDPLIGITNSISANGLKISYVYDAAGRLITVKDSNGKTVKENQYNYKHY